MRIPNVCPPSPFIFHMMSLVHRLGPNDHSSSASSQHIATTSDIHAVVPMMADPNVVLWMSDSPSNRNAIFHGSPHNSPTPHDLGGAGSRTSSHSATGRVYLSPHSFPIPGPIGHTLPMSSQYSMTTSDTHSVVPMMENPNSAAWWAPNNPWAAASLGWSGESQFVPYLHELGGARSGVPNNPAIGSDYSSPQALQMPGPIDHTLPESSQYGMTASDIHSVVHMTTNSNAVSQTPNNLRTAVSRNPAQSVVYVHDLGGVNSGFQLPPSPAQSELLINQPSLLLCRWVHNNAPCGYEGTLEDLRQHWYDDHLPELRGAMIQCQWERCNYHRQRGDRLMNVMRRSSVWRHISEVHLMYRRNS
ncbi:uncharacterized protein HD556DRAFT_124160 [Suillus plorans]|uniref:Uncharacterized protein n=1 Tax=Suillus plorans TaxID=116603 RepID=A0A9P7J2K3_9AGAM|nr:uncharacterized protein HD556DRAFT_124160 [Suillus plorans]KAG1799352.1 hypothetical protein HD556DRAFT_124160 [Suillus plorans]